ncbi:MAG TPA: hypothetical protein VGR38_10270, partial [Candidatus Polarisedimenticolia bacterium]|nr:hypothetical protein [Candidatus Polarisedimenticolia bacterium]
LALLAEAGYASACADIRGGNPAGIDPYQLRRSMVTCHETPWSFAFKVRTGFGMREWMAAEVASRIRRSAPATVRSVS